MSFGTVPEKGMGHISYKDDAHNNDDYEPTLCFDGMGLDDLLLDAYGYRAIPIQPSFPQANEARLNLLPHAKLDSDANWRIPSQLPVPKYYDGKSMNGKVTFDEPQSLLHTNSNGDATTDSPNFNFLQLFGAFYPDKINDHTLPNNHYPPQVEVYPAYTSTYPDPTFPKVNIPRKTAYNNYNDFAAGPVIGTSIPRTPHPTSRYHNLTRPIEEPPSSSVASPTPLAKGGRLSTSVRPNNEAYGDTSPELAAGSNDSEEASDDETVDAGDVTGGGTIFTSLADTLAWQQRQQADATKVQDTTLPSDAEKPALVAKLVAAFAYMGSKTQNCTRTTQGHITSALPCAEVIELMCWDLLEKPIL